MAETSNIKNISQNVSQCRDGKPWKMTQTRMGWHTLHTHWQTRIGWHTLHTLPSRVCVWSVCHPILVCQCVWSVCHPILVWVIFHGLPSLHWLTFCKMFFMLLVVVCTWRMHTHACVSDPVNLLLVSKKTLLLEHPPFLNNTHTVLKMPSLLPAQTSLTASRQWAGGRWWTQPKQPTSISATQRRSFLISSPPVGKGMTIAKPLKPLICGESQPTGYLWEQSLHAVDW